MNIKMLVMDVDGTLTDGKIYIGNAGEVMKAFHVKDGYAIAQMSEYGIHPVIITGRRSEIVQRRAEELGITDCVQGVGNKLEALKQIASQYRISAQEIAYIGDDLNDLECLQWCGHSACPADAVKDVQSVVDYVCRQRGGEGAVREWIEVIHSESAGSARIQGN